LLVLRKVDGKGLEIERRYKRLIYFRIVVNVGKHTTAGSGPKIKKKQLWGQGA